MKVLRMGDSPEYWCEIGGPETAPESLHLGRQQWRVPLTRSQRPQISQGDEVVGVRRDIGLNLLH